MNGARKSAELSAQAATMVTLVCEHDAPAIDLLLVETHQPVAMRTGDRKVAGDGKPDVQITAAKPGFLKCNQSGARRITASDRQIPLGRSREIFDC
jgi:hypothetical protein